MRLRSFPPELSSTVAAWATSPAEALMWCGHKDGPMTGAKVAAWAEEDGVRPYGLFDGEILVGYGELWVDDDEVEVELARLIVAPDRRGTGIGRTLVGALTPEALACHSPPI